MLEKVPKIVGQALHGARAGMDKVASRSDTFAAAPETITLTSPAFTDGGALPARYTEDGAKLSPPLAWSNIPAGAASLVLIVEDPDAPAVQPLVHCIAWRLPPGPGELAEGALKSPGGTGEPQALGKNSFLKAEYLPPDPPTGHGPHNYMFQLFALDRAPALDADPGRGAVVDAMRDHVLAKGVLIGTYERR